MGRYYAAKHVNSQKELGKLSYDKLAFLILNYLILIISSAIAYCSSLSFIRENEAVLYYRLLLIVALILACLTKFFYHYVMFSQKKAELVFWGALGLIVGLYTVDSKHIFLIVPFFLAISFLHDTFSIVVFQAMVVSIGSYVVAILCAWASNGFVVPDNFGFYHANVQYGFACGCMILYVLYCAIKKVLE